MTDFERLREEPPVGVIAVRGPGLTEPLPALCIWFGFEALRMTREVIEGFSKDAKQGSPNFKILNSIALWFWSLESGVSTAFKVASLGGPIKRDGRPPNLIEKFKSLPGLLSSDDPPPDVLVNELTNFCTFRNQFFHDLYDPRRATEYHHSKFARVPAFANELDLVEAMRISVNCLNYYRYVVSGVDLMVKGGSGEPLDIFDNEILPKFRLGLEIRGYPVVEIRDLERVESRARTQNTYSPVIKY